MARLPAGFATGQNRTAKTPPGFATPGNLMIQKAKKGPEGQNQMARLPAGFATGRRFTP